MLLAIDIGNTQINLGGFDDSEALFSKVIRTHPFKSAEEISELMVKLISETQYAVADIDKVAIACVEPNVLDSVSKACELAFSSEPWMLKPDEYQYGFNFPSAIPLAELGADRLAAAVRAVDLYSEDNLIVIDFGTALTLCAIDQDRNGCGGLIMPGLNTSMEALEAKGALLPKVDIVRPDSILGYGTVSQIQSGLYFEKFYALKGLIDDITDEHFYDAPPVIVGTGGFSPLFSKTGLFDEIRPNLTLEGINLAHNLYHMSQNTVLKQAIA